MYGTKAWRFNVENKRKLNTVEMDAVHKSCRISKSQRVRNEKIREMMGKPTYLAQDVQIKQLT